MRKVGNLQYNEQELARLCQELGISYLALFGSYLHGDNTPESDVDLLVEFKSIDGMGLFEYIGIKHQLADFLKKPKVDLVMRGSVDKYIRDQVLSEAKPIYVS
jgi:hypothetical protein